MFVRCICGVGVWMLWFCVSVGEGGVISGVWCFVY